MKKIILFLVITLFSFLMVYMVYQITTKINHKKVIENNIKTIPKFAFQNVNGGSFTQQNIKRDIATIFMYYNSDCGFCNEEAQMIHDNISQFATTQIVFVSFETPDKIKKFAQQYKLNQYDNVTFVCDSKLTFAPTFDVTSLPCIVLYDKNQKLIEKLKGQTKATTLLQKLGITNAIAP